MNFIRRLDNLRVSACPFPHPMYLLFLACGLGGGEILTVSFISGENLENKENKPQIMELRDQVSLYFHLSFVDLRLVN